MKKNYILIFSILAFVLCALSITHAEDISITDKKILPKRQISADSLRWEYDAKTAIFTGNVIMKGEEGEIGCLKMTIFFNEKDEVEKIMAEGNAILTREKQKGSGKIIEIHPSQNLLILKQEAWISSDKATFNGEEIIFDTEKEIINITKGVRGEIQAGSEKE